MESVDARGAPQAAAQPPRDPREVAAGELRRSQAERLDEQHAVLAREAAHQMVLVGPQLGVPVGEPDTDDVAIAQTWEAGIGAMIPGAGACSLGAVQPGGPSSSPVLLEDLRRRFPRVAIVHDWLTIPGGSEQVVLELLEMFPQAELFTTVYDPAPWPALLEERTVHASFLNRIPGRGEELSKAAAADEPGVPLVRPLGL